MNKALILSIAVLFTSLAMQSQNVAVNTNGDTAHQSAILDVASNSHGMLIPRLSTVQRTGITDPAVGLVVFDTDENTFMFYAGSEWVAVVSGFVHTLHDSDNDTRITVENSPDEDTVRIDVAGSSVARFDKKTLHLLAPGKSLFIGEQAGTNDNGTANENTFIGYHAGRSVTSGYQSLGIGYKALAGTTTSVWNTAVGWSALSSGNTDDGNTAIGTGSMYLSTSGDRNTAVGLGTLGTNTGDYNAVLGANAMSNNTTGSNNVAVGYQAVSNNSTGNKIVAVGYQAGRGVVNDPSSGSIFLGYQAGMNETDDNRLYIENSSSSLPLIYGEFNNNMARIHGRLEVQKNGSGSNPQLLLYEESTTDYARLNFQNDSGSSRWTIASKTATTNSDAELNFYYSALGSNVMMLRGDGNVGIGTGFPQVKLHVKNGSDASNTTGGYLVLGDGAGANLVFDNNEILARNDSVASPLNLQSDGGEVRFQANLPEINEVRIVESGRVGIGETGPTDKLHVNAASGESVFRAQSDGATKMRIHTNGGTSIGANQTPPANGLHIEGDLSMDGQEIQASTDLLIESQTRIELKVGNYGIVIDPSTGVTIISDDDITIQSDNDMTIQSGGDMSVLSDADILIDSNLELELNSTATMDINGTAGIELDAGAIIDIDGSFVRLNTEGNSSAGAATIGDGVTNPGCATGCTGTINSGSPLVLIGG